MRMIFNIRTILKFPFNASHVLIDNREKETIIIIEIITMWSNVILIEIINPSLLRTNTCNPIAITKSEDEKETFFPV